MRTQVSHLENTDSRNKNKSINLFKSLKGYCIPGPTSLCSSVFLFSTERLLTIENNNVKFPVAEQLVLVGDAGPETARPPQGQS